MKFLTTKTSRLILICTMVLASLASCTKDVEYPKEDLSGIRVIISNEGQFGYGTASLSAITYGDIVMNDI